MLDSDMITEKSPPLEELKVEPEVIYHELKIVNYGTSHKANYGPGLNFDSDEVFEAIDFIHKLMSFLKNLISGIRDLLEFVFNIFQCISQIFG